ncbi:HNH endonuclease [Streptomyces sp. A7024]|uniref:HNH endonuclease n=2 Tax=Streptomyces coryli TaxID=1128680 RepID=A0A6G4U3R4_9ACTN|nr:HNH endonuclease [Streptomyces coryli]
MCKRCRAEQTGQHVAGTKREALGSVPAAITEAARAELCVYCGTRATGADHLEPISSGGTHAPENLVPACWDCNAARGSLDLTAWKRDEVLRAMRVSERVRARVWDEAHHRSQERHEERIKAHRAYLERRAPADRAAIDRARLREQLSHARRGRALVRLLHLARREGYDDVLDIVLEELTAPDSPDLPEGVDAED